MPAARGQDNGCTEAQLATRCRPLLGSCAATGYRGGTRLPL